jgi:hypothetical protein
MIVREMIDKFDNSIKLKQCKDFIGRETEVMMGRMSGAYNEILR